jgi:hypothetical protein
MSAIQIPRVQAATVLRAMSSGRTKPCLMLCTDDAGNTCEAVIKWRGGKEMSERGLVCELMTAMLAIDLDLPVPKPFIVEVAPNFNVGENKPELSAIARQSAGLNFGCERLPSGAATWPKDKPIPVLLRPLGAEVFAFDVMIQNPDRRRESPNGPNLLWAEDEIYLYDHEQAFSFLMGVIGWQPPWTGGGTEFCRNHVFFQQLTGIPHNFDRLSGALQALTDARLKEYVDAVPYEWRSNNDAADRIAEYLQQARQNRAALFGVINHLLL